MKLFNKKQLTNRERVGERLKKLREDKGWSIDDLRDKTKLSKDNIIAIESSAFHKLPTGVTYKVMFIKRYLSAFDEKPDPFVKQLKEEEITFTHKKKSKKKFSFLKYKNIPLLVKSLVLVLLVVGLVGYLGFQLKSILEPPKLTLQSPIESYTTHKDNVLIKGKTHQGVTVSINGKQVSNNKQGIFEKELELQPGLNTIVIKAKKEHGKTTTVTRNIVVKEGPQFSLKQDNNT